MNMNKSSAVETVAYQFDDVTTNVASATNANLASFKWVRIGWYVLLCCNL